MAITTEEKERLFRLIKHQLGAPDRKIEIDDEAWDSLLDIAIQEYSSFINNWLVNHQWSQLLGLNIPTTDFTFALTTYSLDFETRFSYAYSKIVGLQNSGPWELKKDFLELTSGQQSYTVPAGREINEVLWFTPPPLYRGFQNGYYGSYQAISPAMGNNVGGAFNPTGHYIMPAFDYALRLSDVNLKNRMIFGELIYKVTAGPNGTKIIHLMPTPDGKFDFKNANLNGYRVWYHYYDVGTQEDLARCLADNPDIIRIPTQVPLDFLDYSSLNSAAKNDVRRLLTSFAKERLARSRGKFGGELRVAGAEVTMDYADLQAEAKDERDKLYEEISTRLEKLNPENMMERMAKQAEAHNKAMSYHPFPAPIVVI